MTDNNTNRKTTSILQVIPSLERRGGGAERGALDVGEAIYQSGFNSIISSAGGDLLPELKRKKMIHIELPFAQKNPVTMYLNTQRLVHLIKKNNVKILHARSRFPAWSGFLAAKKCKIPFLTTFHGTYSGYDNFFKKQYNSVMTKGRYVIAISKFISNHIQKNYGLPSQKIITINRGIDLNKFNRDKISHDRLSDLTQKWLLDFNEPIFLLPGRITRWKGHVTFLKALRLMQNKARAIIVGFHQGRTAYLNELFSLVKEYNLVERVKFFQHCDDMPVAYSLVDFVVSASTDPEAFGRTIIESQSVGTPVIATNHGAARENVLDGKTGMLIPPGDAKALANAMDSMINMSTDKKRSMSIRGINFVKENFSKEKMCEKTLRIYKKMLLEED
jgi:glycosyltransferase involved in cell wall biosynthesis